MALHDNFVSTFNQPFLHAEALNKLDDDFRQLMKNLRDDSAGFQTWQAVHLFVLITVHDLKKYPSRSECVHLRSSFRQIEHVLKISKSSESGTDNLSRLPLELLYQIVDKMDRQDQKAFSLVAKSSWRALGGFQDSLFMNWAFRTLSALELPMITIIYELMSFYKKNEHLGSKIIRSFNKISTKLMTIDVSLLLPHFFEFLQLLVKSKCVMYISMPSSGLQ